ncbi:MAG: hypothetical protein WCA78_06900 [Rhizomicrobium sp.]|jgi:hypothetical protein
MRPTVGEDVRKRTLRRGAAAAAVGVLHLLFFFMLIQAEWIPGLHTTPRAEPPLLWLLLPKAPGTPKIVPQRSQKELQSETPPMTYSLPITLPPSPNAIDPALALGQALACGANSYEYLTPQAQARCKSVPWHYKFARDGTIVLDTQYKPPEPKPTPAEVMQQERYTADPCLAAKAAGVECADKIIFGNGAP